MTEITRSDLEKSLVDFDTINTVSCIFKEEEMFCSLNGIKNDKEITVDLGQIDEIEGEEIKSIKAGTSKHIWIKTDFEPKVAYIRHDDRLGDVLVMQPIKTLPDDFMSR